MSRSKLNKLMSRASTLALAAVAGALGTGGVAGTAEAGTTVNTPGSNPHVYNFGPNDFVSIGTGVTLEAGPQGNSFTNDPNIIIQDNAGTAVTIDASTLLGKFVNNGTIIGGSSDGVAILNSSIITQSFVNNGVITGSSDGISIFGSTIQAGLTNVGTITGNTGQGIDIFNDALSARSFSGGLTNSGTIQGDTGLALGGSQPLNFFGGIQNTGRITGDDGDAIFIGKSTVFSDGINNTSTGKIIASNLALGANGNGIEIQSSSFAGGITNAGTIATQIGDLGTNQAIHITSDVVTFSGGITNSGLISATTSGGGIAHGIEISADTFNNGIVNNSTGRIVADDDGIFIAGGTFNGGITQLQYGQISSGEDGIRVDSDVVFSNVNDNDGIANAGLIDASDDGINVEALIFFGGVTNTGSIDAGDVGIRIGDGGEEAFRGGITNSGDITAVDTGIVVDVETFDSGIHNIAGGTITADQGIEVVADTFLGGVTNSGGLTATSGTALYLSADDITGKIVNDSTGIITATNGRGILVENGLYTSTVNSGFENKGQISTSETTTASSVGVDFDVVSFAGGFTNTGRIQSADDHAVRIVADSFTGGFNNAPTLNVSNSGQIISLGTSTGTAVLIEADTFNGGFTNSGTISSLATTADAININVDTFGGASSGGFTNSGRIQGGEDGVDIDDNGGPGVFNNGFHNLLSGVIIGGEESGVDIGMVTFNGGFTNAGAISSGTGNEVGNDAVDISVTTFAGNFSNSGLITSFDETGVEISASGTFTGNFTNAPTLVPGTGVINGDEDGVRIDGGSFTGNFTNAGDISGDTGVELALSAFTGDFTNASTGVISGTSKGVWINSGGVNPQENLDIIGDFSNAGEINGIGNLAQYGLLIDGVDSTVTDSITGDLTNEEGGSISSFYGTALAILDVEDFEGDITNDGVISSDRQNAVRFETSTLNGAFANTGLISSGNGAEALLLVDTVITGVLTNSGTIDGGAGDGIELRNSVLGSIIGSGGAGADIINSGSILSEGYAIDLSGTSGTMRIAQTAGLIQGDIDLQNSSDDRVDFNGGIMDGDVGGEGDDVYVDAANALAQGTVGTDGRVAAGTFAYRAGSMSIDDFFVNSGTAVLGSNLVGRNFAQLSDPSHSVDVATVAAGATVYLDDETTLNANSYTAQAGSDTQFLLSLDTGTGAERNGQVLGSAISLQGDITAVIDVDAFALSGPFSVSNTFYFENVFQASSTLTDNSNDPTVLNDLIFFTVTKESNGVRDIDLEVELLSFSEVLADASQSANQQAVGQVLETIFDAGSIDPDFAEAFAELLGSSSYDEALAVYDQLLGAEHAQAALGMFNSMSQFQGFLGERMDVLHNGMGSAQWAMFGQPGTQVAAAETVLADASPSPAMGGSSMVTPRNGNTLSMFGGVSGNWASVEGDTNGPGFDQDTVALNAGVDYAFSSETVVGLGGSYQTSELEFESANSGDVDTVAVGLFGTFGLGGGYLDANANVGFHDVSTSRLTPQPDYASAEYSATSWSLSGELGTVIPVGRAYVAPMLSMTYVGVSVDSFTETGSAFALAVDGADTDSFATVLGARAGDYFKVGKATVNLQGNLGWRHEFGDEESSFTAAFLEEPALLFNVDSSKIASDSATFGLGTTVSLSTRMEVFVNYDGVWNAEANSHNAALGVRTTW
jgi:uncharacterized protein with beta-barrel porin domain